jgi:basic amino acid/polyamine antiporter, APA family
MATDRHPSLGLAACTAIVVGNMVGSGFYLSPSAVAPYGLLGILFWIVMGVGAMCLGLTFARLANRMPATGGPYAYTRAAYGDFAGFIVAWGYWISIWVSLPLIAAAFTGSLLKLVPALAGNRPVAVAITLGAIWFVTLTNLRGVKEAGRFAEITTYAKLVPFGAIAILGLPWVHFRQIAEFNPSGTSLLEASAALAPLTMFAYLGLESATVPAGDVRDPKRTIPGFSSRRCSTSSARSSFSGSFHATSWSPRSRPSAMPPVRCGDRGRPTSSPSRSSCRQSAR